MDSETLRWCLLTLHESTLPVKHRLGVAASERALCVRRRERYKNSKRSLKSFLVISPKFTSADINITVRMFAADYVLQLRL